MEAAIDGLDWRESAHVEEIQDSETSAHEHQDSDGDASVPQGGARSQAARKSAEEVTDDQDMDTDEYDEDDSNEPLASIEAQLPPRWEVRETDEGRRYYVDHSTKRTTWERPPRIPVDEDSDSDDVVFVGQARLTAAIPQPAVEPAVEPIDEPAVFEVSSDDDFVPEPSTSASPLVPPQPRVATKPTTPPPPANRYRQAFTITIPTLHVPGSRQLLTRQYSQVPDSQNSESEEPQTRSPTPFLKLARPLIKRAINRIQDSESPAPQTPSIQSTQNTVPLSTSSSPSLAQLELNSQAQDEDASPTAKAKPRKHTPFAWKRTTAGRKRKERLPPPDLDWNIDLDIGLMRAAIVHRPYKSIDSWDKMPEHVRPHGRGLSPDLTQAQILKHCDAAKGLEHISRRPCRRRFIDVLLKREPTQTDGDDPREQQLTQLLKEYKGHAAAYLEKQRKWHPTAPLARPSSPEEDEDETSSGASAGDEVDRSSAPNAKRGRPRKPVEATTVVWTLESDLVLVEAAIELKAYHQPTWKQVTAKVVREGVWQNTCRPDSRACIGRLHRGLLNRKANNDAWLLAATSGLPEHAQEARLHQLCLEYSRLKYVEPREHEMAAVGTAGTPPSHKRSPFKRVARELAELRYEMSEESQSDGSPLPPRPRHLLPADDVSFSRPGRGRKRKTVVLESDADSQDFAPRKRDRTNERKRAKQPKVVEPSNRDEFGFLIWPDIERQCNPALDLVDLVDTPSSDSDPDMKGPIPGTYAALTLDQRYIYRRMYEEKRTSNIAPPSRTLAIRPLPPPPRPEWKKRYDEQRRR